MKRLLLTTAIVLGATLAAHADSNTWNDTTGQNRGDYAVNQDADYCQWQVGRDRNGPWAESPAMKRCMRSRGWAYDHTDYEPWTWRHHHRRHGW
ncbi:MAG: hypothetical protein JO000_25900 [Alphaproteobacteria bacterium]|nr:hypothetical protein [Alphaproteobacteria bacterium]